MGVTDKPFTTYEKQVEILDSKKLEIHDKEEIIKLLKEYSYFSLITGYKPLFKDKKTKDYKKHVTINDIHALFMFDSELRALVLKYILKIENHIKSLMSYSFCQVYGDAQGEYLNVTNYDYIPSKQDDINKLVSKLSNVIKDDEQHLYMKHQKDKYGNVPLWVLTKALTLGVISKMYSCLKQPIQQNISKEFEYVTDGELAQMIDMLSRFRNVCAHNERLYDYTYNKCSIDTTDIHLQMNLKKKKGYYTQGKNDLFAVIIIFKYLLNAYDFEIFILHLKKILNDLLKTTNAIQKMQILKAMGFPSDWESVVELSKVKN